MKKGWFGYAACRNPQMKAESTTASGPERSSFLRNGMEKARNCNSSETAGKKPMKSTVIQGNFVFSKSVNGRSAGAQAPILLAAR